MPIDKRRRLGVATQPRLATRRDLFPLYTRRPEQNRFVLARHGRGYLSTEALGRPGRRGVAGAVAVFGPSQSGKTTGLIDGVSAWTGPAIISSVKADLLRATIDQRRQTGDVRVFDPLGVTGLASSTWSPLRPARTLALSAAVILARSGADDSTPGDKFWRGQAEQLLAGMPFTAANTPDHTMRHVVRWVLDLDRPGDTDGPGTLAPLVRLLTEHDDPQTALSAKQVRGWLHGQWSTDPRTTSSVYATARNAVWPWADPAMAASADSCDLTLDWLLADTTTTDYLSVLSGTEHVRADLAPTQPFTGREAQDRAQVATAVPYASADVLRRLQVGDAYLVHGHLPPA